ncbi:MAG: hypothetical protein ACP5I4_16505 [Oceanipulchritudo sp.]|jgi:uncharacterized protein YwgA
MNSIIPFAQLFKFTGPITGRKKLQKMVHLLQACGGASFGVTFSLGRYGAFSSGLASVLDQLTESGLVQTNATVSGDYPTQAYSASEEFLDVLDFTEDPEEEPQWVALARELNSWQMPMLEATSTIVYLKQAGWENEALEEQFRQSKPHLMHLFNAAMEQAVSLFKSPELSSNC